MKLLQSQILTRNSCHNQIIFYRVDWCTYLYRSWLFLQEGIVELFTRKVIGILTVLFINILKGLKH